MAKLTGPLFGISARGTIADTITYSGWKGIEYARQRVVPANPQTAPQMETRNVFTMLGQLWLQMQTLARAPWIANAVGRPYIHRNALVRTNLPVLRSQANMNAYAGSPGAMAGMAPASIATAYDAPTDTITVTLGAPTLPPDWLIQAGVATAFPDQDPSADFIGPVKEAQDLVTPYAVLLVAALPLGVWQCSGWFRYTRPDGRTAYGPSLTAPVTVT